ncbi:MAG: tetratricopeptide repeat protein, partial [Planctomycetota bacterium]|nr:tetratricopeptide repeat protein [Planctomycetota bacterium]
MCYNRRDVLRPLCPSPLTKFVLASLAAMLLLGFVPVRSHAQVRIPTEALSDESGIQQVFQRGTDLESQRRWGEALAYYETAVKDYPDRRDLWD